LMRVKLGVKSEQELELFRAFHKCWPSKPGELAL
jgi:hypothetical protein